MLYNVEVFAFIFLKSYLLSKENESSELAPRVLGTCDPWRSRLLRPLKAATWLRYSAVTGGIPTIKMSE